MPSLPPELVSVIASKILLLSCVEHAPLRAPLEECIATAVGDAYLERAASVLADDCNCTVPAASAAPTPNPYSTSPSTPSPCSDSETWDATKLECVGEDSIVFGSSFLVLIGVVALLTVAACIGIWCCYVRRSQQEKELNDRMQRYSILDGAIEQGHRRKLQNATTMSLADEMAASVAQSDRGDSPLLAAGRGKGGGGGSGGGGGGEDKLGDTVQSFTTAQDGLEASSRLTRQQLSGLRGSTVFGTYNPSQTPSSSSMMLGPTPYRGSRNASVSGMSQNQNQKGVF